MLRAADQSGRLVANVPYYLAREFHFEHRKLITHPSYQPSRKARKIAEIILINLLPCDIIPTHPPMHYYYVKELRELFPISEKNPNGHSRCRLRLVRWRSIEGSIIYEKPIPQVPSTSSFWI